MKYIIEFEDEPYMREDGVDYYTCKSARWYKLEKTIINRLTPYTEPDRKVIEDEVWGLARRIICPSDCCEDSISAHTKEIFNKEGWEIRGIFNDLTYQEAKDKYEAWKNHKKDSINVGDEVVADSGIKGVVTTIRPSGYIYLIINDGGYEVRLPKDVQKTGRHFPEVVQLLKDMRYEK